MTFRVLIIGFLIVGSFINANSQGCSDAGVCSIGGMGSGLSGNSDNSAVMFTHTLGIAENFTLVQISQLESRIKLLGKSYLNLRLPFQFSSGNLGNVSGVGDIAISFSQELTIAGHRSLITVGGIIPTNDSDLTENGRALPMDYQSSLGSYDLIFGGSYFLDGWQFSIGYQHPFNRNKNGFLHTLWSDDPDALEYFESNQLKRGDDLIFRVEKRYALPRSIIYAAVVPIIRLEKDEIIKNDEVVKLDKSSGLTLNLNFTWEKNLSDKLDFRLSVAGPAIWRKTRADGLTRGLIVTPGLIYRF